MSAVKTVNTPQAQKRTNVKPSSAVINHPHLKNGDVGKNISQQVNKTMTTDDENREQPEVRFSRLRSSAVSTAPRNGGTPMRKERSKSADSRAMDTKSVSHRRRSSSNSTTSLPFIEDKDEHAENTPAKNAPDVGLPANFHPGRRGAIVSLDGPYNPLLTATNKSAIAPATSASIKPSSNSRSASLPTQSHVKREKSAVSKTDLHPSTAKTTKAAKKSIDKVPSDGAQTTSVTTTQRKNVYYVCYAPPTNLQEPDNPHHHRSTKSAPKRSQKHQEKIYKANQTAPTKTTSPNNSDRETAEGKKSTRAQSLPTSGGGRGTSGQDANPAPSSFREIARRKLQQEEEFLWAHPSETKKRHKFRVRLLNKKDKQHKPETLAEEGVHPSHADGNMGVGKINIKPENNDSINNTTTVESHPFVPFRNKDTFSFRQKRSHTAPIVPRGHQGGGKLVTMTIKPSSSSSFSRSPSASISYHFDPDEFCRTPSATHRDDGGVKGDDSSGNLSKTHVRGLSPRKITALRAPPSINYSSAGISGPPTPSFSFVTEEALSSTMSRKVSVVADPPVVDLLLSESASTHPNYHCHRPHYHTARCGTTPIILECDKKRTDFAAAAAIGDADATTGGGSEDNTTCNPIIHSDEQKHREEFSVDQSSRMGEEIIHLRTLEQNPLTPRGTHLEAVNAIATVSPSSRSLQAARGTSRSSSSASHQGRRIDSPRATSTTYLSALQRNLTLGSNASLSSTSSDLLPLSLPRVGSLCILDQSTPRGRRELFVRKRSSSAVSHNEMWENRCESLKKEEELRELAIKKAVRNRIDRSLLPDMGLASLPRGAARVPEADRHLYHVGQALSLLQSQQAHVAQQQGENRWQNAESEGGGNSGDNPFASKREASDAFDVLSKPSAQPSTAVQNHNDQRNSSTRSGQVATNSSSTAAGAQSGSSVRQIHERSGKGGESIVNIHKINDSKTPQPSGPTRQTVGKSVVEKEPKAVVGTQKHRKSPAEYKSTTLRNQKKIEEKIYNIKDREIDLQKRIVDFSQGLKQ